VSRRDAKIRFVSNEAELGETLSRFGFEMIVMSEVSLADQINMFSSAECIVGPHGAAFANLAFSKEGSTFIEFFRRGQHFNPCFNRIATIRGLKYGSLVGESALTGGFSIYPNQLKEVLSQALST
jgi:capsular polysaccharide biosynthesis protein